MSNVIVQDVKQNFLYPIHPYHGKDYFKGLIPNRQLQQFTSQVSYIAGLHNNGKLSPQQAYQRIETLWEILESAD
ncbi:MAG: hypothetical protein GW795_08830 [Cyanobacteria bacterium]|nr:hypothetical protein [Cyanobacteria bacterium CG_2015-16_32_12]NCO77877.1 hypothetical protein [Cyanobacteria bacterium CG_2015-22_32_23]NCQ03060.1 hypothetical protein [Cyanobacteria bacterium CG_2015-09_32_10]NCQ41975.1 hypothetical protein [Cyanobacteria bacterium CG_2015-04_32_10]NCS84003.1 hypothetical protein [Cyanobacteria bacterium CG_2015-02_32_10]